MNCHICGAEAVERCYQCGELFCTEHGRVNCVRCAEGYAEGDPRRDRVSETTPAKPPGRRAWWRPQPAEDFEPPACYVCRGLARRACPHCRRIYCSEHAAPNGRSCQACASSRFLNNLVFLVVLIVFTLLVVLSFWKN